MTSLESGVMGYICFIFGVAFGLLDAPWLSLLLLLGALGFLSWTICKDYVEGGGGPGPLKPA